MKRALFAAALLAWPAAAVAELASSPGLGTAEGRCRPNEAGPAVIVTAEGLKDRTGLLRVELYPPDDADFLADDNVLLGQGKTFRRAEIAVPAAGPVRICIRAPAPGTYTLSLLHDRDGDHKFSLLHDGIGFPGNPVLHWAKPRAAAARVVVGAAPARTSIVLNYRRSLVLSGPIGGRR